MAPLIQGWQKASTLGPTCAPDHLAPPPQAASLLAQSCNLMLPPHEYEYKCRGSRRHQPTGSRELNPVKIVG